VRTVNASHRLYGKSSGPSLVERPWYRKTQKIAGSKESELTLAHLKARNFRYSAACRPRPGPLPVMYSKELNMTTERAIATAWGGKNPGGSFSKSLEPLGELGTRE